MIPFRKMNGLGNDFVVMDARGHALPISGQAARAIGDRVSGIGCDQIIVLEPSERADVTMRIWNNEGSEVESCGNASRCIADILFQETGHATATIDTKGGFLSCTKAEHGLVTVDMGVPRFGWRDIPLSEPVEDTNRVPLVHAGLSEPSVVNVGNPHAIFWVEDAGAFDLARIGPELEHHALFPKRANISLAEVKSPDHIILHVWERGAGITRACGTAACAVGVAAARIGHTGRDVRVTLPGGDLRIVWDENDHIQMTGAVAYEFDGHLPEHLARLIPA
ncbi:MAG: diaminopimelate epimerase [Aestuariivirgaceae bacterium]|nr:diaminopimelate epimerase [Aestuariivirgaceae bacterium]